MKCLNEPTPGVVWINCMDLTVPFLMVYLIGQLFKRTKKKKLERKGRKKVRRGCDPTGLEKVPSTRLFLVCLVLSYEYQEGACWLPKTCLSRQNRRIHYPAWVPAGVLSSATTSDLTLCIGWCFPHLVKPLQGCCVKANNQYDSKIMLSRK